MAEVSLLTLRLDECQWTSLRSQDWFMYNGMAPTGNKPLPEPMLTRNWHHLAIMCQYVPYIHMKFLFCLEYITAASEWINHFCLIPGTSIVFILVPAHTKMTETSQIINSGEFFQLEHCDAMRHQIFWLTLVMACYWWHQVFTLSSVHVSSVRSCNILSKVISLELFNISVTMICFQNCIYKTRTISSRSH